MLALLARSFGCPSSALFFIDPTRPRADITVTYGPLDAAALARYSAEFAAEDPAPAAMARLRVGEATTTGRLFGREMQAHGRFLREFYYPLGLREALGGPIANEGGRFGVLAVHRGPDRPAFTDDEIVVFERVMPHVAQVVELRRAFFQIETRARRLSQAADLAMTGIMVFDVRGVIHHANRFARETLARADGLALDRSGRLRIADPAANARLRAEIEGGPGRPPAILRAPRSAGQGSYALVVRWTDPGGFSGPPPGLTVQISDPWRETGDVSRQLVVALDLTEHAARLVAALLGGEDLDSYARRTGVSLATVKFHLRGAFAATGTRRQADLVRLAGAVVRDLGLAGG